MKGEQELPARSKEVDRRRERKKGCTVAWKQGRTLYVYETDISIFFFFFGAVALSEGRAGVRSLRNIRQCLGRFGVVTTGE